MRSGLAVETRYVGWGAGIQDFDNDGLPDVFWATGSVYPEVEKVRPEYPYKTPRVLFRNLGSGKFEELIDAAGPAIAEAHSSRGVAFGDFDNDGDVDILIMNVNEPPSLLRNDVVGGGHWMKVEKVTAKTVSVAGLPDADLEMLKRHAAYGCLTVVCRTADATLPFIFFSLRKRRGIIPLPVMQLGYCRSIADYIACAGAIGRYLLLRGKPIIAVDASGGLAGLPGIYSEARGRKYYKGPHQPRLGDLADTELAIYGM